MNILKLMVFVFLCASGCKLLSATLPFRLGDILSTEISRNKVVIRNMGKYDYDFKFKHYVYAVVAFTLHKGRSLSIYDFELKFKDKAYKCVALAIGNGAFDVKRWHLTKTNPKMIYSLLFILDSEVFGNAKKTISATLVYTLSKSGQVNYELPFKFINYDKLTTVGKIPVNGVFPKIKIDTSRKAAGSSEK